MVCCVLLEKPTYLRLLCFFLFPTTTCRILESNKIHLTSLGTQIFSNASVYLAEPRETRTSKSPPPGQLGMLLKEPPSKRIVAGTGW